MELAERIQSRDAEIGVVGLGYVGLPLAVELSRAGFRVLGVDVDAGKVSRLAAGESYVTDVDSADVRALVGAGRLRVRVGFDEIGQCDVILICVPTPLSKTHDPDISFIVDAAQSIRPHLAPGSLVVLESTTYPGFTREVLLPLLTEEAEGPLHLAFSPERIDPGNREHGLTNTPKIIGGLTDEAVAAAEALYSAITGRVVRVSSADAAEMVKLLENTFRAVNIGLVNEFSVICDRLGLDVWEVIDAAATKSFGFMPFYPGPGLGGHCIPVDPLYLAWRMRGLNYRTRFIDLATEINRSMPHVVVDRVMLALNEQGKPLRASRILLLGVAYKRDVGDTRESPAEAIIELLESRGASVRFHDPHVRAFSVADRKIERVSELTDEELDRADCVLIVTDHTVVDYAHVLACAKLVVDTRNATKGLCGTARLVKL